MAVQTEFEFRTGVQSKHLSRVLSKIQCSVLDFTDSVGHRGQFHMNSLVLYVQNRCPGTAPDSPSRILRILKRKGLVDYEVVSRRDSQYMVLVEGRP